MTAAQGGDSHVHTDRKALSNSVIVMLNDSYRDHWLGKISELCKLPHETEWVEFKVDNNNPHKIGENISALANSALLHNKDRAYIVWGIEDETHDMVGTNFLSYKAKKGNEPLEAWLLRKIKPDIDFSFHDVTANDDKHFVILEIFPADKYPVAFDKTEYIRIGSSTRELRNYPEKEKAIWRLLEDRTFEQSIAAENLNYEDILQLLDYASYFKLLKANLPDGHEKIVSELQRYEIIKPCDNGRFNITNLGAILFAVDMRNFSQLSRKAVRIIQYTGTGRLRSGGETESRSIEIENWKGYASSLDDIAKQINSLYPRSEIIEGAVRHELEEFPVTTVRELVANAFIHQDLSERGSGPMIELFRDRIEITNPGKPSIPIDRFIDEHPPPRNQKLAYVMRQLDLCEERGSGIDNALREIEVNQLPPPLFSATSNSTRVVLFARKPLNEMDRSARLRACYQHACLQYVTGNKMTNKSLRTRFGLSDKSASLVSGILNDATNEGLIVPANPSSGNRIRHYLPHWAVPQ